MAVAANKDSASHHLSRPRPAAGFDFTWHMRRLCTDLAAGLSELAHIDMPRVAIRFCQARKDVRHGLQASLTPLRFENGQRFRQRRGQTWTVQRVDDASGREMLYLLSFYLPRFLDRPFEDKLSTVIHELWHISPDFNGDLRRHPGRYYAHSHSQKEYDVLVSQLAYKWLAIEPASDSHAFLQLSFDELARRHGRIYGQRIRTPKLIRAS